MERAPLLLLLEQGSAPAPPELAGREVLVDPARPEACMVKGVMLVARQKFLRERFGERELQLVHQKLSPGTHRVAVPPLSGSWVPFSALVEYDRAIFEQVRDRHPDILVLVGAASAAYGIGTIYRVLDNQELAGFLGGIAHFHELYQRYGRVVYTRTPRGAVMEYFDYPCYSPVFCASGVGFFLEAILRHGGRDPEVRETRCHCRGDGVCRYEMTWR